MGKDKKKKDESKKAKLAEKKLKQANKADKKAKLKTSKLEGDDEDVDLEQVLEEYKKQQEQFLKITETVCEGPPQPRAASCFLASPCDRNNLLLFGGEYFNGSLAKFYNDLHIYNVDRDEWRCVTSPNCPLPRSGSAWCRAGNPNHVYLFGGEFSSPKQGTFHHYSDFWRLEPSTREWMKIECKGKKPPARSGHRMTYWKHYIILFGGFQDTSNQTKYLNDLWIFDTQNFMWFSPALPTAQLKPDPRSSFTLLPHESGAVLFGGYSRTKTAVSTSKQAKGSRNIMKPVIHQDCFFLRMTLPPSEGPPNALPAVRWERRKKPANCPNPPRAGATMTFHKGRGILFGGVHDVEESEDGMNSEFFNGLFAWNIDRNRFFPLTLRKPRVQKKTVASAKVGRRGRAQADEEELLKQLAALETGASLEDADAMELDRPQAAEVETSAKKEFPVSIEPPRARFNAQMAVQDDVLFVYGGTVERGDREFTLNDLHVIDLDKMDGCKQIFNIEIDDWIESEDEDEDEDDEDEDEDEDDEDDGDEMDIDDDVIEEEPQKQVLSPSKRKKNQGEGVSASLSSPITELAAATAEEETEAADVEKDDGKPHPRPFETRRDFFTRTSNEWQEILMTSMRWQGVQPESLTVKEIKTKAFELSEEKWWDCREEITALEEEQEAAGITEVVSLAERGDAGPSHRRR